MSLSLMQLLKQGVSARPEAKKHLKEIESKLEVPAMHANLDY